jgi:hypothetical protein
VLVLVLVREFVVIIKICKSPTFCEHEMGALYKFLLFEEMFSDSIDYTTCVFGMAVGRIEFNRI